ncbi:MAG: hypothetical protein LUE21_10360 [Oscillospiraceae bacterium]|nr:hypothetical protein [Oscillospiraceae bacterium]
MCNAELRARARERSVHLWEIAARFGCNDGNFSRKLRREFSDVERERALSIIDEICKEREEKA